MTNLLIQLGISLFSITQQH